MAKFCATIARVVGTPELVALAESLDPPPAPKTTKGTLDAATKQLKEANAKAQDLDRKKLNLETKIGNLRLQLSEALADLESTKKEHQEAEEAVVEARKVHQDAIVSEGIQGNGNDKGDKDKDKKDEQDEAEDKDKAKQAQLPQEEVVAMECDSEPVVVNLEEEVFTGMDEDRKKALQDSVNKAATEALRKKARRTSPPTKSSSSASGGQVGPEQLAQMQAAIMDAGKAMQGILGSAAGQWGSQSLQPRG